MVFANPSSIRAENAGYRHARRSGNISYDRSVGSCRSTKSCRAYGCIDHG
jgi:hypothetical protein